MPNKDDSPLPKSVNENSTSLSMQANEDSISVPKPVLPPSPHSAVPQLVNAPPNVIPNSISTPEPPQYRMPPPVLKSPEELLFSPEIEKRHYSPRTSFDSVADKSILDDKSLRESEETPPKLHPRKSSNSNVEKSNLSNDYKIVMGLEPDNSKPLVPSMSTQSLAADPDQTVSVKERKQMFNKMASDVDVLRPRHYGNRGSVHVSICL